MIYCFIAPLLLINSYLCVVHRVSTFSFFLICDIGLGLLSDGFIHIFLDLTEWYDHTTFRFSK